MAELQEEEAAAGQVAEAAAGPDAGPDQRDACSVDDDVVAAREPVVLIGSGLKQLKAEQCF